MGVEGLREGLALLGADDALVLQILFVSDEDGGHLFPVLYPQNLLMQVLEVVECRLEGMKEGG